MPIFSKKSRYFYIPLVFLTFFSLIALVYIKRDAELDRRHFQTHAAIIADDIWAVNESGARAYLQLAVKADSYQSLSVSIPGDDNYLHVTSAPLSGLNLVLHEMGLIGLKELAADILHEDQSIGTLHGRQYVQVFFPLVNILVFLLLVLLTGIFIIYLFINRKFLEQEVLERTRNLKESERRFHDLVDLLPEMVLETDLHGGIVYHNKAATDQLHLTSPPLAVDHFFDFIVDEDRQQAEQHFHASLYSEGSDLQEFTAKDRENRTFPILVRSAPISRDQVVTGARMIVIDITERHRLEEQLRRDEKMKAIGLMAGGVAHDLNNILSGIISYPELMLLDLDKNHKLRRPLEAIRKAGMDASEVVSDLLTVARGIAAGREVINPNVLIGEYLASPDFHQLSQRYPLIGISSSLARDLRNVRCSPIHIRKCLMNLITNGMEAIQSKGMLTITTENHKQLAPMPRNKQILPEGDYAKIVVYDSGSGIAAHEIEHIFEPFYSKKVMGRSGTGLGLAVVWNTMRDHGGIVNVISNGQGTTFELYFPSVEGEAIPAVGSQDWQNFKGNGERVVVIDDDPRQRAIARELLTGLNYSVVTLPSGEAAVEFLGNHTADILVLDMIMDPGQNGRITYEKILNIHPRQKALIASGYAEDDDVRATLALGAEGFVGKPYTLETISSSIYNILKS